METIWRQVSYKGTTLPYEVSNFGEVRSLAREDCGGRMRYAQTITPHLTGQYLQVILQNERKRYSPLVHTLVAFAFLEPPPSEYGRGKISVNHKNCIKTDNRPENLEWVTCQENSDHAIKNKRMKRGEDNPVAKFTEQQVLSIRRDRQSGDTYPSFVKKYNSSLYIVWAICHRKIWKHV